MVPKRREAQDKPFIWKDDDTLEKEWFISVKQKADSCLHAYLRCLLSSMEHKLPVPHLASIIECLHIIGGEELHEHQQKKARVVSRHAGIDAMNFNDEWDVPDPSHRKRPSSNRKNTHKPIKALRRFQLDEDDDTMVEAENDENSDPDMFMDKDDKESEGSGEVSHEAAQEDDIVRFEPSASVGVSATEVAEAEAGAENTEPHTAMKTQDVH